MGVWNLVALDNQHLKLSKLVFADAPEVYALNACVIRDRKLENTLLVLLEVNVVHFVWQ